MTNVPHAHPPTAVAVSREPAGTSPSTTGSSVVQQAMRRRRLWELDPRFHCPVIGACLSIEELQRLARKAGIGAGAAMSDYGLHHGFVQVAGSAVFAARLLDKQLDRKYESAIQCFRAARDGAGLESLWRQALAEGEVAGAFWALLTHPGAPEELVQRAYEELHMLSHLAGHTNRAARAELATLRRRAADLEDKLQWTTQGVRVRILDLERQVEALDDRAREAETLQQSLLWVRARLALLENAEPLARLSAENEALKAEVQRAEKRAHEAADGASPHRGPRFDPIGEASCEAREWAALALAADAPTPPLSQGSVTPAPQAPDRCLPQCDAVAVGDCPGPDLCGRRILYVGGCNRQVAHFRTLVERLSGELLYHDGGLSESATRLDALLERADVVFCPLDCVSHDACQRIKKICRRAAKPFVLLRSASLASLEQGLRRVVALPGT